MKTIQKGKVNQDRELYKSKEENTVKSKEFTNGLKALCQKNLNS